MVAKKKPQSVGITAVSAYLTDDGMLMDEQHKVINSDVATYKFKNLWEFPPVPEGQGSSVNRAVLNMVQESVSIADILRLHEAGLIK